MQNPHIIAPRLELAHDGCDPSEPATAPLLDCIDPVGIVQMNESQYIFVRDITAGGACCQKQGKDCEEMNDWSHMKFRNSLNSVVTGFCLLKP
jgi:hypothetical protein